MSFATRVRHQVESVLSAKVSSALSPRLKSELDRIPCGIAVLDEVFSGGLPVGVITELIGNASSGRTSTALTCVSAIHRSESVCAWIDVSDVFDPETAAANGVDLERLLWIRCGKANSPTLPLVEHTSRTLPFVSGGMASFQRHTGGGSPHPRSEDRNMPEAISTMFQAHGGLNDHQARRSKRFIGTPGAPNRPLNPKSEQREEQVNSDRLPPRRGDNLSFSPRCAKPLQGSESSLPSGKRLPAQISTHSQKRLQTSPWQALDQALRATDLLLQSGGFSAIVLDLGNVPPEIAWRIPLATWFRFRAACERTRVCLILLTQHPCARSAAELVVRLHAGSIESQNKVMTGIRYRAATERNRSQDATARVIPIRKPPQSERGDEWLSSTTWVYAR